jgi:glycosyltransferase involved in cell wall biosynthesis
VRPSPRIAIVHDWLVVNAGGEMVLRDLLLAFPEAALFSMIDHLSAEDRAAIGITRPVHTSVLQHVPGVAKRYRGLLPMMPLALRGLDVSGYDIVLSVSHAVAKGVRTRPGQLHVCYCLSPMRYAWDLREQYLREAGRDGPLSGPLARTMLEGMRRWDLANSRDVDRFLTLSTYIADRIARAYGRESAVIYPPVDTEYFTPADAPREDFYVTASRMVPYKRVDMIAAALRELPDRRLVIIGTGPDAAKVRAAAGANVEVVGHLPRAELRAMLQRARAYLFAAEEDFGIAPVEAQACGTPVIAYGRGGAVETVRGLEASAPTGVLYEEQSASALAAAIRRFEGAHGRITAAACRANAERFARARFRREMRAAVLGEGVGPGGFEPPHVGL